MKRLLPALLALTAAISLPRPATAADLATPHVAVYGTAVTQARPDLLRWSVTVSNTGPELAPVSEEHAKQTAAVLRLLGTKTIKPEEIQTSGMQFSENREFQENRWVKNGYIATTQVAFTLRNLAEYQSTWTELARLPGVSVNGVSWDLDDRTSVQNKTRLEALRSAKAKAEEMARALGVRISTPLAVEEEPIDEPMMQRGMVNTFLEKAGGDAGGDPIASGQIAIRIRVRVVFQLETSS